MGNHDPYEDEVIAEHRAWDKEAEQLVKDIGAPVLRREIQALIKGLSETQQSRYVWQQIRTLEDMLKLR